MVQKGEALEQWQEQLQHIKVAGGKTLDEQYTLVETKQIRDQSMKKVIEANLNMNSELRGIFKDGEEVRGIVPSGWGSIAHVRVDRTTGEIEYAERMTTPEDNMFAVHYINHLEKHFRDMKEADQHSRKQNDIVASTHPEFDVNPSQDKDSEENGIEVMDNYFTNEFDIKHGGTPQPKASSNSNQSPAGMLDGMDEIQEKRLNLTTQYHGDLSGASLLAFARGARDHKDEEETNAPKEIRFDELGEQQQIEMSKIIKKKEQDLKHKLQIKSNLKNIMKDVDDQRFANMESYFKVMIEQHRDFFANKLSGNTHIRNVVMSQAKLTLEEKNQIIYLHNHASNDDVYGARLYVFCQELAKQGKVVEDFPNQIYVLSVDWPLDFLVDHISKNET